MNMSWPPNTSNWTPLFCPFIASCVTGSWCMTASARWLLDLHHRCQDLSGNTKRRALRFHPQFPIHLWRSEARSRLDGLIFSSPARLEHMHAISRCLKIKSSCNTTSFPNGPEWLQTYRREVARDGMSHCQSVPCPQATCHHSGEALYELPLRRPAHMTFLPPTLECCIAHVHCLRKRQHFHPVGESQYETPQQKLVCRTFLHPEAEWCILEAVSCGGKPPLWRSIVWPPIVDLGVSDLPLLHQVLQSTVWVAHAETWTYDIPSSDGMLQCPWRLEPQ